MPRMGERLPFELTWKEQLGLEEKEMTMTLEQEKHLARIKSSFVIRADAKYRKGQKEHGGNLFDKADLILLDNAIDEAIDMVIYLETLRESIADRNMNTTVPKCEF